MSMNRARVRLYVPYARDNKFAEAIPLVYFLEMSSHLMKLLISRGISRRTRRDVDDSVTAASRSILGSIMARARAARFRAHTRSLRAFRLSGNSRSASGERRADERT